MRFSSDSLRNYEFSSAWLKSKVDFKGEVGSVVNYFSFQDAVKDIQNLPYESQVFCRVGDSLYVVIILEQGFIFRPQSD